MYMLTMLFISYTSYIGCKQGESQLSFGTSSILCKSNEHNHLIKIESDYLGSIVYNEYIIFNESFHLDGIKDYRVNDLRYCLKT